ncbi:unnamed protein product [Moneuplotes crassus]|uniref:Protein kinase domain-containing protein n=1 Tax=Euplotes crassus TaxID=5936 RepID=A0AAD1U6I5_EUPCR|nr:unnamed protein product [Moneuplotes crassus]
MKKFTNVGPKIPGHEEMDTSPSQYGSNSTKNDLQETHILSGEFYEFIQKCTGTNQDTNSEKYSGKIEEMFGVSQIDQIFFQYQDGSGDDFSELFEYRAIVGIGAFGVVISALDKETGEEIAIKMLNLDHSSDLIAKLFRKEAETLRNLHKGNSPSSAGSPERKDFIMKRKSARVTAPPQNIIGFKFFKEYSNYLLLGMELCTGGNLQEWIKEQRAIKNKSQEKHDEECSVIIKNILHGISYIHDRFEILHRDLKPANVLFAKRNDLDSIKICDFGFANERGTGLFDQNNDNVGTLIYQAPEQMKSVTYGKKVDIWATGMIMYELLTKGGHPFLGIDFYNKLDMNVEEFRKHVISLYTSDTIDLDSSLFSPMAYKMLKNLLNVNPNLRYSSQRALKHPWITRDLQAKVPLNVFEEMQLNMKAYEKLKFATQMAFAMSMIEDKVLQEEQNEEFEAIIPKRCEKEYLKTVNKSKETVDVGKSRSGRKMKLIFKGNSSPISYLHTNKKEKHTNNTTIKNKGFRIKTNKGIKKKLFSANTSKDDLLHKDGMKKLKPLKPIRQRTKISELSHLEHQLNKNLGRRNSGAKFHDSQLIDHADIFKENDPLQSNQKHTSSVNHRSLMKKKKKTKIRRLSDIREITQEENNQAYPRVSSIENRMIFPISGQSKANSCLLSKVTRQSRRKSKMTSQRMAKDEVTHYGASTPFKSTSKASGMFKIANSGMTEKKSTKAINVTNITTVGSQITFKWTDAFPRRIDNYQSHISSILACHKKARSGRKFQY